MNWEKFDLKKAKYGRDYLFSDRVIKGFYSHAIGQPNVDGEYFINEHYDKIYEKYDYMCLIEEKEEKEEKTCPLIKSFCMKENCEFYCNGCLLTRIY